MAPPEKHTWGAHNVQPGAPWSNIEDNAKIFQQFLNATVPMSQKVNKKCAAVYPQVEGGLPPHLLNKQDDTHDRDHRDTHRATAPASRSYERASDSQPSESAWSTQPVPATEVTPAASVDPPPWEDNLRAQQMVMHNHKLPTTPTGRGTAPRSPVPQPRSGMHPALQAALANQARIRNLPTPVARTNDAWVEVYRNGRGNRQRTNLTQEVEQSSHQAPDFNKKKWRPSHSSCWGSQSLPTSDASVKLDSNKTNLSFQSDQPNGGVPFRDVRGSIADDLDIVPKADGTGWYNKNYWKEHDMVPASESSEDSFEKGWHSSYCRDWVQSLSGRPPPLVAIPCDDDEIHWECDIDTKDGMFLPPVEYPQTTVNSRDPGTREELVRRLTSTAEIKVTMEAEKLRKRIKEREKKAEARGDFVRGPGWRPVPSSTPVDRPNASGRSPQVDPREPHIPCFLRPVERDDLPQILDIYNWEVEQGRQAMDAQPLTLRDIQRLVAACDAADTPFIVAVKEASPVVSTSRGEESALVRSRGNYQLSRRSGPYKDSQQAPPSTAPSSGKVLGFGLVTIPPAGLAGDVHTSVSRFNGKVHLYVEPQSRRLGVGRCILHRLLRCCSKRVHFAGWYDWRDPHDSRACAESGYNTRTYARVFVEVASFKGDPEFNWRKKLLQEMNFVYVNTTDQTRKIIQDINGGWLDNTVWQHDCSGPGDVRGYHG